MPDPSIYMPQEEKYRWVKVSLASSWTKQPEVFIVEMMVIQTIFTYEGKRFRNKHLAKDSAWQPLGTQQKLIK